MGEGGGELPGGVPGGGDVRQDGGRVAGAVGGVAEPNDFIPVSFDSGGVTTGPITVPFIMALGVGLASVRNDKNATNDSFGLVALCSIGPILSVLVLGICYPGAAACSWPGSWSRQWRCPWASWTYPLPG